MFTKLELLIAMRYLKSKRKEGFISVIAIFSFIGIVIGVATLIIVMSVMNGFRFELINRILGINSHLNIYSRNGNIKNYDQLIKDLSKIQDIQSLNPLIESQAMISYRGKNNGALIRGITSEDLHNKKLIAENIIDGNITSINDKNSVIIGSTIAQSMNLQIGDKIKIISAETNETIFGSIPRIKTYKIGGIFSSGLHEYDSSTIFMNFEMAQIHFKIKDSANSIEIFLKDINTLEKNKKEIFKIINSYEKLYIGDWQNSNSGFIDALKIESTVMFLILTLIILVAVFNIISSMIMLVNDKNKNIALLRTLGMSKLNILRIFLICGSSIGVFGTLFGLIIGISFASNINNIKIWLESLTNSELFNPAIYFLSTLPSKIFISDLVIITIMTLTLSFLATLYPAYKASKANPSDILRYE
jgi:lipoprotein-releasing system permease protein